MTSKYHLTVGLEIHAELKTRTKMFCDSPNDPDENMPNVNICPICMGHPGTLPVINKEAVRHVLRVGTALGGSLADFTEFDRKNYFYPDIPKGYQLSQYKFPLVKGGSLNGVAITRVHLEEDTATSLHEEGDYSLVDYNRAGVPLMELVTEPVIKSAKEASDFARELQLLLRYLGASDANMEKGEMRVEANISVARATDIAEPRGTNAEQRRIGKEDDSIPRLSASGPQKSAVLGTKVEVKNLNSFKSAERAIEYEFNRQVELLESGERIVQETRGFDEGKGTTFSQRMKEESHDYRYFPEPDLPKLYLSELPEFSNDSLKKSLPELPAEKRKRYEADYNLSEDATEIFVASVAVSNFLESVMKILTDKEARTLAINYLTSDLMGLAKQTGDVEKSFLELKIKPKEFANLISMIRAGELSSRGGKDVLGTMFAEGGEARTIAESKAVMQKNNEDELKEIVKKIISDNPKVVADYKSGKVSSLQFLVGQGMKLSKGSANPAKLGEIIKSII